MPVREERSERTLEGYKKSAEQLILQQRKKVEQYSELPKDAIDVEKAEAFVKRMFIGTGQK